MIHEFINRQYYQAATTHMDSGNSMQAFKRQMSCFMFIVSH